MATSKKKAANAASKILRSTDKKPAARALAQPPAKRGGGTIRADKKTTARGLAQPAKRGTTRMSNKRAARSALGFQPPSHPSPSTIGQRPLPGSVDEETIARLVAEAEEGIPAEKLRRRGRPAIGVDAASTYSVRLPDDLVTLADERSEIDGVTRGETIRRALIEYLTN